MDRRHDDIGRNPWSLSLKKRRKAGHIPLTSSRNRRYQLRAGAIGRSNSDASIFYLEMFTRTTEGESKGVLVFPHGSQVTLQLIQKSPQSNVPRCGVRLIHRNSRSGVWSCTQ